MNQKGFSLIELMVVVAIIGILSAVAVPQFQKFQRKAKQSEAKAMLSGLYTAQKIFLAETGSYYSNIWAIGFEPEGSLIYTVGHTDNLGASLPGYTNAPYRHNENRHTFGLCGLTYASGVANNCMYQSGAQSPGLASSGNAPVTASTFTALARAQREFLGGSSEDWWTMNHRKEIINTLNGAL